MLTPPLSHEQRKIARKKIKKRFWLCGEKEIDSRKIIVETERFYGLGSISLHTLESNKMYAPHDNRSHIQGCDIKNKFDEATWHVILSLKKRA
jgi:hypothetical protein